MTLPTTPPSVTPELSLYPWQEEALQTWLTTGNGTVKVVTGAGKTILGLGVIRHLWLSTSELKVAIIVPTIVLMNQWLEELQRLPFLTPDQIGCAGGGKRSSYSDGKRIIIWVLPTASKNLLADVNTSESGDELLLIVDECHRAGSAVMSRIFSTPRRWSLGLSATPERNEETGSEDDSDILLEEPSDSVSNYSQSPLGRALGPIVYTLSLKRAIDIGLLPPFNIKHYGLDLDPAERETYDSLSRSITDSRRQLQGSFGSGRRLMMLAQRTARGSSDMAQVARRFITNTQERKRLLFRSRIRAKAAASILEQEFKENSSARVIIFHESIAEVEYLSEELKSDLPLYKDKIAVEHSKLPAKQRSDTISSFRDGKTQVLVSVKSLIEGFNVPAADVGIIVASSTSVRQRVQTMGRILRRFTTPEGVEKQPSLHVLYIRNSVDDAIYGIEDWGKSTGYERNEYYHFNPPNILENESGPPRTPLPGEGEINPTTLVIGGEYPGKYEGKELTCDTNGNIKTLDGDLLPTPQSMWQNVLKTKGSAGRFMVTPVNKFVLVRKLENHIWVTRYAGNWDSDDDPKSVGTGYAGPQDNTGGNYRIRQRSGRKVICWEIKKNGLKEQVCRGPNDNGEGDADIAAILSRIEELNRSGININRFQVNSVGDAICSFQGKWEKLISLSQPIQQIPES